jgi:hypothetical protein
VRLKNLEMPAVAMIVTGIVAVRMANVGAVVGTTVPQGHRFRLRMQSQLPPRIFQKPQRLLRRSHKPKVKRANVGAVAVAVVVAGVAAERVGTVLKTVKLFRPKMERRLLRQNSAMIRGQGPFSPYLMRP